MDKETEVLENLKDALDPGLTRVDISFTFQAGEFTIAEFYDMAKSFAELAKERVPRSNDPVEVVDAIHSVAGMGGSMVVISMHATEPTAEQEAEAEGHLDQALKEMEEAEDAEDG
jgi:molybdenum cofactor biosynthesis enzyme MoaA